MLEVVDIQSNDINDPDRSAWAILRVATLRAAIGADQEIGSLVTEAIARQALRGGEVERPSGSLADFTPREQKPQPSWRETNRSVRLVLGAAMARRGRSLLRHANSTHSRMRAERAVQDP